MAKVKGDVGQVKFDDGGSSVNPVLGTTSWSMSITKDTQETTVQGDTFKQFVGGLIEGEGSAELLYDDSASGETATFVDGVLTTGDLGTAAFELFPDSSSATKKNHSMVLLQALTKVQRLVRQTQLASHSSQLEL